MQVSFFLLMQGMEIGDGDLTPFKPFQEGFPLPLHVSSATPCGTRSCDL